MDEAMNSVGFDHLAVRLSSPQERMNHDQPTLTSRKTEGFGSQAKHEEARC
jgi:hypothetical protein